MIVGIGGQGVMTLGKFFRKIPEICSKIHGLISMESRGVSQREGSVYSLIRYSLDPKKFDSILAPTPPIQGVDLIIALEPLEFFRNIHFLNPEGIAIINTHEMIPKSSISSSKKKYPNISDRLKTLKTEYPNLQLTCNNYSESAHLINKPGIYSNFLILDQNPSILQRFLSPQKFSEVLKDFFKHD